MKPMRFSTPIKARPDDVFKVLTDYENYPQWNPWLTVVRGEARQGAHLLLRPRLWSVFGAMDFCFEKVEPGAILYRKQEGWFRYLVCTHRERLMYTKVDGSTLYTTSLGFTGPLAPLVRFFYARTVWRGIKAETLALKKFCEQHYGMDPAKAGPQSPRAGRVGRKPGNDDGIDVEKNLAFSR